MSVSAKARRLVHSGWFAGPTRSDSEATACKLESLPMTNAGSSLVGDGEAVSLVVWARIPGDVAARRSAKHKTLGRIKPNPCSFTQENEGNEGAGTTFKRCWPSLECPIVSSKWKIQSKDLSSDSFVLFVSFCSVLHGSG